MKKTKPELSIVPDYIPPTDVIDHATEDTARTAMINGVLDMQETLYKHASRYKDRLRNLSGVIKNLENRVFDEEFINDLDPRSMIKLLVLARESEKDAVEYLERLHKLVLDSQRVTKITQTLSVTGGMSGRGDLDVGETPMDKLKMEKVRKLLMGVISPETEEIDE